MTGIGALFVGLAIFVLVTTLWPTETEEVRFNQLAGDDDRVPTKREIDIERPLGERLVDIGASKLGARLRSFSPDGMIETTETKLHQSGLGPLWTVERILAIKVVAAVIGVLVGAVLVGSAMGRPLVTGTLLGFVGFIAPDAIVDRRADERQKALQRELPNMIDQISVSVEAGLGFEQALVRVAEATEGFLGVELRRVVRDIQLGMSRSAAMDAMVDRTGLDDMGRFVRAIRLAERQGLAMAVTLNMQSAEIRSRLQLQAEERAMQIPVKLTFPLVLFILPALFLIILGPAFLNISEGL